MNAYDKPLITVSGNESLLTDQLSLNITRDLPEEGVEWQRSYGRSSKIVYLEAQFVALNENHLQFSSNELQLFNKPLLFTYWTDCCDLDVYKNTTRDEINAWISKLKDHGINDWFIVHIDNSDTRKGINKTKLLSRSSVLDKIKNDLPPLKTNVERCITLLDQQRNDSKAIESYQLFLIRLRSLLLQSYSKQLIKYEDYVRTQRENRNSPKWNFFEFFFLQEELAFAFEMLSLYDEALVQYDELDALFSQFVINSNVGEMPEWLQELGEHCDTWHGLCLTANVSKSLRELFKTGNGTLLDLRNYLFSRQCELLFLLNKPWELASRSLPFLQNCVNELNIMEITMMSGGIACWVFLSALEILQKCERYSDSSQMETYSLHTVELWAYARNKLAELGSLCGLMPGMTMTSDCLHKVVNLIAGMGHDPRSDEATLSPQQRLKEALSGQEVFLKHYLEISELTMGTYKHIGRKRYARLIGKELAQLYLKLNKTQQAIPFLLDLEKVYLIEKWPQLLSDIRSLLLQCYQMTNDVKREFKVRCQLSASSHLNYDERIVHYNEALKLLNSLETSSELIIIRLEDIFSITDISLQLKDNYTVTNCDMQLIISLTNHFPITLTCNELVVSLNIESVDPYLNIAKQKNISKDCVHSNSLGNDQNKAKSNDIINSNADIETFHSPVSVGIKCNNSTRFLKRSESHGSYLIDKDPEIYKFLQCFQVDNLALEPGINNIKLTYNTKQSGIFTLKQMILKLNSFVNLVSANIPKHICFNVIEEEPTLKVLQLTTLEGNTHEILSGVSQSIVLQLNCGSSSFDEKTTITIKASHGLKIKLETDINSTLNDEISFELSNSLKPFQTYTMPLIIKSKLNFQKDAKAIEHQLIMSCTPNGNNVNKKISVLFHVLPPFHATYTLHTFNVRKFLEIFVHGGSSNKLILCKPQLKLILDNNESQSLIDLKASLPKQDIIISKDQTVHYLWEMIASKPDLVATKAIFSIDYKLTNESNENTWYENYDCEFKLYNYQTLYTIKEAIEPQKGTEFCRVGSLCYLNVIITSVNVANDHSYIMYEIITDQTLWNLNGRTAGVVTVEQTGKYELTFEVMPLISGFLPLPSVRISKYLTTNCEMNSTIALERTEAKLIAFELGQVYNWNRATQIHVLPSSSINMPDI